MLIKFPFLISIKKKFFRIYTLQGKGYAYTSVDLLMKAMNPVFIDMTKITIYETLAKKGYSEKFIDEMVQSIMMVNYGQTTNITGFVGKYFAQY